MPRYPSAAFRHSPRDVGRDISAEDIVATPMLTVTRSPSAKLFTYEMPCACTSRRSRSVTYRAPTSSVLDITFHRHAVQRNVQHADQALRTPALFEAAAELVADGGSKQA